MNGRGLILAAHGSRYEPAVNTQIRSYAAAIDRRGLFDEVGVAFHQGHPAFNEAVDQLHAADIVVAPVMTSAGYYADLVLPRELKRNRRYNEVSVRQTIPLGLHPGMADLVHDRINDALGGQGMDASGTTIVVVGHGTPQHTTSRSSTETLAAALRQTGEWPQVFAAFIDEEPFVETVPDLAAHSNVLVIPFLIGSGPHAVADIPMRLGLHVDAKAHLPTTGTVNGRTVFCDAPVGADARIIDLLIDLATLPDFDCPSGRSREIVA